MRWMSANLQLFLHAIVCVMRPFRNVKKAQREEIISQIDMTHPSVWKTLMRIHMDELHGAAIEFHALSSCWSLTSVTLFIITCLQIYTRHKVHTDTASLQSQHFGGNLMLFSMNWQISLVTHVKKSFSMLHWLVNPWFPTRVCGIRSWSMRGQVHFSALFQSGMGSVSFHVGDWKL